MVRWAVSSPYLYSVTGPLSSYTPMHFALTTALGGRYCERLHLQDVENEAQRCDDTCPRPHSQEVVELGPAYNHPSWGFRAHTGYIPALECGALRQRSGCRSLTFLGRGAHLAPVDGAQAPQHRMDSGPLPSAGRAPEHMPIPSQTQMVSFAGPALLA